MPPTATVATIALLRASITSTFPAASSTYTHTPPGLTAMAAGRAVNEMVATTLNEARSITDTELEPVLVT